MAQLKNTDDKQPKFHSIDSVHSASASGTSTIQNAINELKPIKTECNAGPTLTSIDTTLDALNAQLSSNSKRIEHSYYNPLTHWGNVSSLRNPYQEYDAPRNANLKQNNNSRNQSYQNKMDKHHLEHMLFSAPDDAQSPQKQRMRQILQKRATKKSQNSQSLPKRSTAHDDDGSKYYLTEITDDHKHRKKKKRNNQRARNKRQMKKKSKKQLKKQEQASRRNRKTTSRKAESHHTPSNAKTDIPLTSDRVLKPHEILQNEVENIYKEYTEIAKSSHPLKATQMYQRYQEKYDEYIEEYNVFADKFKKEHHDHNTPLHKMDRTAVKAKVTMDDTEDAFDKLTQNIDAYDADSWIDFVNDQQLPTSNTNDKQIKEEDKPVTPTEQDDSDALKQCDKKELEMQVMDLEQKVSSYEGNMRELRRKCAEEMKAIAKNESAKREQMQLELVATNREKDLLKIRLNAMEHEMDLIKNECKSLRRQNAELQAENQRLQAMDKAKYLSWSCEDVGRWIVSLNPDYAKYEQRLFTELADEGITGNTLRYVKMSDIKDWGIKNIMNRQHVFESIQALLDQGQQQAVNEAEGNTAPGAFYTKS